METFCFFQRCAFACMLFDLRVHSPPPLTLSRCTWDQIAFGSRSGYTEAGQLVLHNFQGTWKGKKAAVASPPEQERRSTTIVADKAVDTLANPDCSKEWLGVTICIPKDTKSPSGESVVHLFDESPKTKWLSFHEMPKSLDGDVLLEDDEWLVRGVHVGAASVALAVTIRPQ